MKSYRLFGFGVGLALAAAALFASPTMAYEGSSPVSVKATYHDLSFSYDHSVDLSILSAFEVRSAYHEGEGGTVMIEKQKHSYIPLFNAKSVKPTVQAGWRSGRLRYLSAG